MQRHRTLVIAALLGGLLAPLPAPAQQALAAADNMLGMAIMAASISSTGTLVHGSGVTSVTRSNPGFYEVVFDRSVDGSCFRVANARGVMFAWINPLAQPNALQIIVTGSDGTPADGDVNVLVYCAS